MARFISIKVVGGADAFEDGQHLLNTDSVITVTSGDEAGANEGTKTLPKKLNAFNWNSIIY